MVSQTTLFKEKKNRKGKNAKAQNKPKFSAQSKSECFFCKKNGHWKRNCKSYLRQKDKFTKGDKGIRVIPE